MKQNSVYIVAASIVAAIFLLKPKRNSMLKSNKIADLHPAIRRKVELFLKDAKAAGYNLVLAETLRSYELQQAYYNQGRTTPGDIITDAKPGESYHNFGLAFDVAPIVNGRLNYDINWQPLVSLAKQYGFTWGGTFRRVDKPHFEYRPKVSLKQLAEARARNGTIYPDIA